MISILDVNGDSRTYYLKDSGLIVAEGGLARNPEYIMRGMYVRLSRDSYGSYISRVEITGWSMVEGRVNYIQTSGPRKIEIIKSGGGVESYSLTDSVTVREGGVARSLEYASVGGKNVRLVLNSYRNVTRIFITDWLFIEGTVNLIQPVENGRIEIRRPGGGIEAYYLAAGVTVREGDTARSLDSVTPGRVVRLTLNVNNRITRIFITGSSDVEGKVVYVQMAGKRRIGIQKSSGAQEIYYLADNVSVMEGGSVRSLYYLVGGMNVRLFLNNYGEAVQIMVSGPSSVDGRVVYISTSGTRRIQIEKGSGALETYSLANGVTVREGGVTRYLSYIKEGMSVRLDLNSDGEVHLIEFTGTITVEGRVRSIQTWGTKWIDIEKAGGLVGVYDLAEGVWVRQGGITLNLTGVLRDMRVRLTLDSNWRVARIDVI